jgi:hypothetical protein
MGHPIPERHSLAVKLVAPGGSIPWTQQAPVEGANHEKVTLTSVQVQ